MREKSLWSADEWSLQECASGLRLSDGGGRREEGGVEECAQEHGAQEHGTQVII
jgi:hypothetical protein